MSKPSQDYLIDECNNLLKIIQGQFEKINQSFYCKVIIFLINFLIFFSNQRNLNYAYLNMENKKIRFYKHPMYEYSIFP